MLRSIVGLLLLLLVAPPAFGWGCSAHQTIALVALGQLNPHARQMVKSLLAGASGGAAPHRFCSPSALPAMADLSTWADDEREHDPRTASWHFVDIPLSATRGSLDRFCGPASGCLALAIRDQLAVLGSPQSPRAVKRRALLFLVHFIGDLHQPLHVTSNNDRGGNCLPVTFLRQRVQLEHPATGGYRPDLHGVWDRQLPERVGGIRRESRDRDVRRFARSLGREFAPELARRRREPVDVEAWIWESHRVAIEDAYGRLPVRVRVEAPAPVHNCTDAGRVSDRLAALREDLQEPYVVAVRPALRRQLAQAGGRLAAALNQLWP